VSPSTIYRDIETLASQGAPIAGEAGLGYILKLGFVLRRRGSTGKNWTRSSSAFASWPCCRKSWRTRRTSAACRPRRRVLRVTPHMVALRQAMPCRTETAAELYRRAARSRSGRLAGGHRVFRSGWKLPAADRTATTSQHCVSILQQYMCAKAMAARTGGASAIDFATPS
jgi:hypothetical protein